MEIELKYKVIKMTNVENLSFDELKSLTTESLTEFEVPLLQREANINILDNLVRDALANPLFATVNATVIVGSLKEKFARNAVSGDLKSLAYVGGIDIFERALPQDRSQQAMFLDTETGEFDEFRVFGSYPGFKETGEFLPGNLYDIEIQEKQSQGADGTVRTFKNLKKYTLNKTYRDEVTEAIKTVSGEFGAMLESDVEGDFTEPIVTLLTESVRYETVPIDFEVVSVKALRQTERYLDGDIYKFRVVEPTVDVPINYVSDKGLANLAFSLVGTGALDNGRSVTYFLTLYPSNMGQYFIESETINEIVNSKNFQTSTPAHQADFLKILLSGKEFRALASIRRLSVGNDISKLMVNANVLSLVQL